MGLLSILRKIKQKEKELRILVLGLDNAGKTTVVRRLTGQSLDTIQPTLGFAIHTLLYHRCNKTTTGSASNCASYEGSLRLHLWDIGGQRSIRGYWRNYFDSAIDGLIWVVDSVDSDTRLMDMAHELDRILQHERLAGATVLLLANKQDVPGAMTAEVLANLLPNTAKKRRHWKVFACSAVTGEGLVPAMDWMVEDIASRIFLLS